VTPYADSEALADYLGSTAPADAARLLARASDLMDTTVLAPFGVDPLTDLPADPDIAAALANAVCAQVEFWSEVGEANDVDGLAGTSYSMAGFNGQRPQRVAPRALDYLRLVGLLTPGSGLDLLR
jgi:hypothetical protein